MRTNSPHDALFKSAFGQPDIAGSELELLLPREVAAHLDLATLEVCPGSFVDEELRHAHTDLLYAIRTTSDRDAFVYVLFEHQSSFDASMPLRLLRYVVRIWETWLRDHPAATRIPIVLPVLLHHGATGWRAEPALSSMLDADAALLEATRPFVPHFRFLLDDLKVLSVEALASRELVALARLVQLAFWSSGSLEHLEEAKPFMRWIVATVVHDERAGALMRQLSAYVLLTAPPEVDVAVVRTILLEIAGPEGQEDVMNAAEQLIAQGRAEGLRAAEQLIEQGRAEGLRTAIATALSARAVPMSELAQARLTACADVALLTRWLTRAMAAASESDVFSGDAI